MKQMCALNEVRLALFAILIALISGCGEPGNSADVFRANLERTGVFSSGGPSELNELVWKFKTEGPVGSSPVISGGLVYFGSLDGHLYAVDIKSGQEKWKFKTEAGVFASPAIAGGLVFFGSGDRHLYAVK